jgi:hypothetical protein
MSTTRIKSYFYRLSGHAFAGSIFGGGSVAMSNLDAPLEEFVGGVIAGAACAIAGTIAYDIGIFAKEKCCRPTQNNPLPPDIEAGMNPLEEDKTNFMKLGG